MASCIFLSGLIPEKFNKDTDFRWAGIDDSSYVRPIIAKGNRIEGIEAKV